MKKNIKFLIFGILLLCFISVLIITISLKRDLKEKTCNNFELETLAKEIVMATNNNFIYLPDEGIGNYLQVSFSNQVNYVFSRGGETDEEYFIIAQNLTKNDYLELKNYVETNNEIYSDKQIEMGTHGEYTYAVYSKTYISIIEGIIRSYVYCN